MSEDMADAAEVNERYECPVCLEYLHKPVKTQTCQHIFCRSCFQQAIHARKTCPVCREIMDGKWERARDIEAQMKVVFDACKECNEKVSLFRLRRHLEMHKEPLLPELPGHDFLPEPGVPPRYTCPYCQQTGLMNNELRNHCNSLHREEQRRVVCPICASMPWGNGNYQSRNFIRHLNIRHTFSVDDYVDSQVDESVHLQRAIFQSFFH